MGKVIDKIVSWWVGEAQVNLDLSRPEKLALLECKHVDSSYAVLTGKKKVCRKCYQRLMKENEAI